MASRRLAPLLTGRAHRTPSHRPSTSTDISAVFGRESRLAPTATSPVAMSLKRFDLYHGALSNLEIWQLAHDGSISECLDLEYVMDDPGFRTDFGQTCANLAEISDHGEGVAPGGCRFPAARVNCPVACMHELVPACFDGMAPVPDPGSGLGSLSRCGVCRQCARKFP